MKNIDFGLLVLRLALAAIFIGHGMQKLLGAFGGPGIEGFTQMLSTQGFFEPAIMAWIVALVEFLGGICLLLGVLPRISALGIAVIMIVAIAKFHFSGGFFSSNGGFEYQLLILASAVTIMLAGAGKFALFNKF